MSNFNDANHTFNQAPSFGAAARPNHSFSTPPPPSFRPGSANDGNHSFSRSVSPTITDYSQQHLEQRALLNLADVSPQPIFPLYRQPVSQKPVFLQQRPAATLSNRDAERAVMLMILIVAGLLLGAYFVGCLVLSGLIRRFKNR